MLGDTPEGRHCPSCTAVAGQVHTMAEWDAAGVKPGAGVLCCRGNCKCRLDPTADAAGGVLKDVPVREQEKKTVENSGTVGRSVGETVGEELRIARMGERDSTAEALRAQRNCWR